MTSTPSSITTSENRVRNSYLRKAEKEFELDLIPSIHWYTLFQWAELKHVSILRQKESQKLWIERGELEMARHWIRRMISQAENRYDKHELTVASNVIERRIEKNKTLRASIYERFPSL